MLTSILGLRSPLASIINPNFLTLTLVPSDNDKSPSNSRPSSSSKDDPSPKALATISLLSGTVGLAAMTAVQSLTGYLLLMSLFGPHGARVYMKEFLRADVSPLTTEQVATRAVMARNPLYAAVFLPVFSALSVALPEELLKYLPVVWLARRQQGREDKKRNKEVDKRAAVKAATAASLGFALVELAAYVHAAGGVPSGPSMAITLLERILVALPGHFATGVLSASRGAGGGSGWRAVLTAIAPSVGYHALFDFILLASSALVGGHVGWVHPEGWRAVVGTLGACVLVQGVLYVHTARAWLGWGKKTKGE